MAKLNFKEVLNMTSEIVQDKPTSLLPQETIDILNYRIQQEQYSSRIYEQISLWLNDNGYKNLSELYTKYANEELTHANWAKDYILSYSITPKLKVLNEPNSEFTYSTLQEILDLTLSHELEVTRQCNELASYALKSNDHVLYTLGSKYCAEQREEIEKATTLLDVYKLSNNDLFFDHYIGENYLD